MILYFSSELFFNSSTGKGLATNVGLSACSSSVIPFSGQRTFDLQSSGTTVCLTLDG
jgi:hypothetical protein